MIARVLRRFPVKRLVRMVHEEAGAEAAPKMFGVISFFLILINQGKHPREEWEIPTYLFMAGGLLVGAIGLGMQKNTSIVTWARERAHEKLDN